MTSPLPQPTPLQTASARSLQVLLHTYLREYAEPQKAWEWVFPRPGGPLLRIAFPLLRTSLLVGVSSRSRQNRRFTSSAVREDGTALDWRQVAELVIGELAAAHQQPFNHELLTQVDNSHAHMQQFLSHPPVRRGGTALERFIVSEQSLSTGHAFHPAPKAREGWSDEELFAYSPELQAEFPLFYFQVAERAFVHEGGTSAHELLRTASGLTEEGPLLGVHPWQAQMLLATPCVQRAIDEKLLRPLGAAGLAWTATSSVRTLFSRHFPYFLKQSLNLRLTNCVRKNAWYELESALSLNRLVGDLPHPFPDWTLLAEPAYVTLDVPHFPDADRRFLRESFSTLFRDAQPVLRSAEPVLLAAALFGGTASDAPLHELVLASGCGSEGWLQLYCRAVLWPALFFYAEHGVVFEPHLQNTLLRCSGSCPAGAMFRDLEGTKLVRGLWQDRVGTGVVAESTLYSDEQAWRRFVYCMIFNQLWEVIDRLPSAAPAALWDTVRRSLRDYLACHGTESSQAIVKRLLQDETLPVKGNLTTRFLRSGDRHAAFLSVPNPLLA